MFKLTLAIQAVLQGFLAMVARTAEETAMRQARLPRIEREPAKLPRAMTVVTIFDDSTMEPKFDMLCYGLRIKDLAWVAMEPRKGKRGLPEDFKGSGGAMIIGRLERRGIAEGHYASIFAMREER